MAEDNIRVRNALLLYEEQGASGTAETPTAADNAILAEAIVVDPEARIEQTNEHTGSLDGEGSIVGGMTIGVQFNALLKGSGTAGTAPEWGTLLKACGWGETDQTGITAEDVGSGSTTTAVVLGTSASSVDDAYNGMPLQLSGDMTDETTIVDYVGSTKTATVADTLSGSPAAATTDYAIPDCVRYGPASSSIPNGTIWVYQDGLIWKLFDCRGTFSLDLTTGGIGRFAFQFQGLLTSKSDGAVASGAVFDTTRPPVFRNGSFKMNRVAAAINAISLNPNNTIALPPDPNQTEGYGAPIITRRGEGWGGEIDPQEALVATRDLFTDFRNGNKRILAARFGATAGNKVAITVPNALYRGHAQGDREGLLVRNTPFEATGADDGAYITLY